MFFIGHCFLQEDSRNEVAHKATEPFNPLICSYSRQETNDCANVQSWGGGKKTKPNPKKIKPWFKICLCEKRINSFRYLLRVTRAVVQQSTWHWSTDSKLGKYLNACWIKAESDAMHSIYILPFVKSSENSTCSSLYFKISGCSADWITWFFKRPLETQSQTWLVFYVLILLDLLHSKQHISFLAFQDI